MNCMDVECGKELHEGDAVVCRECFVAFNDLLVEARRLRDTALKMCDRAEQQRDEAVKVCRQAGGLCENIMVGGQAHHGEAPMLRERVDALLARVEGEQK